ncbi:hypothetical protein Sxan_26370 [Streptomyces xanthophaeus]|uniref:Uncharacterized protein n=1 Tax=Streptomyces xanthophaeus TaxID=67385 RepID=A0A919GUT6_9ACTN|nr:hypothetical protein Sxan_26370 [Streptomyces xanthophaeus]
MSRSALLLLLEPPGTEAPPEVLLELLSLSWLPPVLPPLELELEPEPELLLSQLPPWEPRAPVSATTAIPKTATART